MPREFLPKKRARESKGSAKLFPRTEARVVACTNRMMDRGVTKRHLREMAETWPETGKLEHVAD